MSEEPGAVGSGESPPDSPASGTRVDEVDTVTRQLSIPEMDCASCAETIRGALEPLDGVIEIETQPAAGRAIVTFDSAETAEKRIVAAIESVGYGVSTFDGDQGVESPHAVWRSRRAIKTWFGAAFLVGGLLFQFVLPLDPLVANFLGREFSVAWLAYAAAAAIAGEAVVRGGYYAARAKNLNIDLLMSAGIVGALLVNLPFEAATLAVLFSIAELLERFSMDRARTSLRELMTLAPDVATVRRDGEEHVVPVAAVEVGETVVVRPGDRIPLDGLVVDGHSAVDESPITGESVPVEAAAGDEVYAGSIVEDGYLEIETTAEAGDSTIAQVIDLVADAERTKTQHERFVDRFARYYTPIIIVGAILTVPVSLVVFSVTWEEAFVRGLTLLVIACPCAFVISTPVSVVSGITSAARRGVLIKGGASLEAVGEVGTFALDKTGTLTTGELGVTDVIPLSGMTEVELLSCARALEQRSEHPIASAIAAHAEDRDIEDREVEAFEALQGKGVKANLDGETHYAGTPRLFAELGFDLEHAHVTDGGPEAVECEHGSHLDLVGETLPRLQASGKTVVLVGTEHELEGVIAIADTIRPEARTAISQLKELGLEVVMLTGDNERTAREIATQVGIDDIRAGLLPAEKVAAIEELRERGGVAMVGDGVNDAPALAAADVGVAMGAAGTDTAIETADVALLGDDLSRLPYLYRLAHKANGVIRSNIWSSLAVKALLAIGAPLGLVSVIMAIVIGDMGMSLAVTSNALRLARVE